jgi:hypothetical protein
MTGVGGDLLGPARAGFARFRHDSGEDLGE